MKKRWASVLLALALACALLPGTALAAEGDGPAGGRLAGADLAVYRVLRAEAAKIAGGSRTSTVIDIPDQPSLSWTLEELGAAKEDRNAAIDRLKEKTAQTLHLERVCTALSLDCPYEMFWSGLQYTYNCSYSIRGGRGMVQNLTVSFRPAQDYRGEGEYTVNPAKVDAARAAAERAGDVVAKHKDESDEEKIASYCREICDLVSYDSAATGMGVPYGDPWQLVSVFDGDPATNVVCEGYAKAFQYLCDLSSFQGDVACHTVTGTMNGGRHMWNVVRMGDGAYYLVDVTNCDSGAVGAPDKLLLAGGASPDGGRTHRISAGPYDAVYIYREEQEDLYAEGYLALSGSAYVPDAVQPGPEGAGFTDLHGWCDTEARWAADQGITNGYGGRDTFAPDVECTHEQILTMLWRALEEPEAGEELPVEVPAHYAKALNWAYEEGLMDRRGMGRSAPCTRLGAVYYIWKALGAPEPSQAASFSDVDPGSPVAKAVSWAVEEGITKGYGGGDTFAPDRVCTRGEIACFLYRAFH